MKLSFVVDVEVKRVDKAQSKATREMIGAILGERLVGYGEGLSELAPPGSSPYTVVSWGVRDGARKDRP